MFYAMRYVLEAPCKKGSNSWGFVFVATRLCEYYADKINYL